MPENEISTPPRVTPARVVAAICVVVPFVAVLAVPLFNKRTPEVAGFPFYFWWQLLWVVLTAALMALAYVVVRREELARKAVPAAIPAQAVAPESENAGTDDAAAAGAFENADSADSATASDASHGFGVSEVSEASEPSDTAENKEAGE